MTFQCLSHIRMIHRCKNSGKQTSEDCGAVSCRLNISREKISCSMLLFLQFTLAKEDMLLQRFRDSAQEVAVILARACTIFKIAQKIDRQERTPLNLKLFSFYLLWLLLWDILSYVSRLLWPILSLRRWFCKLSCSCKDTFQGIFAQLRKVGWKH